LADLNLSERISYEPHDMTLEQVSE
jgi:hypothetical protein